MLREVALIVETGFRDQVEQLQVGLVVVLIVVVLQFAVACWWCGSCIIYDKAVLIRSIASPAVCSTGSLILASYL